MHEQHSKPQSLPDVALHTGLQGFFKIEAKQPDGTVRVLADWFPNLITDIGLNRWGTGDIVRFCGVGTGTTQPAVTDTGLTTPLAFTAAGAFTGPADTAQSSAPYFITVTRTFSFAQGAVTGQITEVSVGWAAANGSAWSHARIKNGSGEDTSITVTAIEQLSITYQLRLNIVTTDVVTTPTIGGVVTTVTLRPANVTDGGWAAVSSIAAGSFDYAYAAANISNGTYRYCTPYPGPIGPVTGAPSGASGSTGSPMSTAAYANNSLYIDATYPFNISQGNLAGGIGAVLVAGANAGFWQAGFSPAIAKDNAKTLNLTFRFSWARA
jgi:hypothetical protein